MTGHDDSPTPAPADTPEAIAAQDRRDELQGTFRHVFGGEIPEAERAWRRGDETEGEAEGPPAIPEAILYALEALPTTLRDLRAEVRRTADMATDALAAQAHAPGAAATEGARPFDPLPAALRELREEVREAVDRATESLVATRKGMDALPAIVTLLREEFEQLTGRMTEALTAANLEAARAFALVAREVRTLGDRQSVLREEIRLLGKRFEEAERIRRRAQTRTPR